MEIIWKTYLKISISGVVMSNISACIKLFLIVFKFNLYLILVSYEYFSIIFTNCQEFRYFAFFFSKGSQKGKEDKYRRNEVSVWLDPQIDF